MLRPYTLLKSKADLSIIWLKYTDEKGIFR